MQSLSDPSAFENFAKQALGEFCEKLSLDAPHAVTHFLVGRDPGTGEALPVPRLHQVEWTDMKHVEVRQAERHFAEKNDVLAAVSLWCELDDSRVMMVVQHREGVIAGCVAVDPVGPVRFGQLEPLTEKDSMHAGYLKAHFWSPTDSLSEEEKLTGYTQAGYYFWDETEANVLGPYPTREEAESARKSYRP